MAETRKERHAIVAKTIQSGATEAEALAVAEKAGELMDRYRISMTDLLEVREEPVIELAWKGVTV